MIRRPPRSTRPYTLLPDTTLFRAATARRGRRARGRGGQPSRQGQAGDRAPDQAELSRFGPDAAGQLSLKQPVPSNVTSSSRSEEHTSELQSLMRISYAVFCLKKKKQERK